ncbi:Putative protein [Zobellia galactanivorans]|uniref:Uncharacterized protein n=1 Tax=Zobellia galactanivorans (strain DSM 12802 / CCUG 47099 / CIP 106680 / NCIMB 13871 / Dsij) TaxID=63186 RepID=G0L6C4_ZOBGA|nr:Putative protein [Zobellia galactanivorans]
MNIDKNIEQSDFFASDLFLKWREMIEKAENSIWIFTPY